MFRFCKLISNIVSLLIDRKIVISGSPNQDSNLIRHVVNKPPQLARLIWKRKGRKAVKSSQL